MYGLSRPTIRRAIAALVEEQRLFVVPKRGTYVAEPQPVENKPEASGEG
jgi:DNA-binding GntR family transcriptional regulator